jgi:hypothetical protein
VAFWEQEMESPCTDRIYAAARPPGGAFSEAVPVSSTYEAGPNECTLDSDRIAVSASGRYLIAGWSQHDVVHVVKVTG